MDLLLSIFLSSFQVSSTKQTLEAFISNNKGNASLKIENFVNLPQKMFIQLLSTDRVLRESFHEFLKNVIDKFDFSKPHLMRNILELISEPIAGDDNKTVKSIFFNTRVQNKRDFNGDRLTQILHEVCCQVFYYLKYTGCIPIVEVQSLCVSDYKGVKYIFFAVNPLRNTNIFNKIHGLCITEFKKIITTSYSAEKMNLSEKKRSQRHATKLQKRIYNEAIYNADEQWNKVGTFVKRHGQNLKTHTSGEELGTNGIYLLDPLKKEKGSFLHAEQQLCDLITFIRKNIGVCKFQITGKKRPCMGCFSRMEHENEHHNDLTFNPNPGYIWIKHFENQEVQVRKKTLKIFLHQPSHLSVNREERRDRSEATESGSSDETTEHPESQIEQTRIQRSISANEYITESCYEPDAEGTAQIVAPPFGKDAGDQGSELDCEQNEGNYDASDKGIFEDDHDDEGYDGDDSYGTDSDSGDESEWDAFQYDDYECDNDADDEYNRNDNNSDQ